MTQLDEPKHVFEASSDVFHECFAFEIEKGLTKDVRVARNGRRITVDIQVTEGSVIDVTEESFEADGPVRISVMDSGLYLTSSCTLLAGRVRLLRTRFF